jgi:RNA polymerase sigma factor (sigma-70 family)
MAGKQIGDAVRQFQRLLSVGTSSGLTDDQLLARFVSQTDDAAFEALVERHGPMVLSVCRGVLTDPNDAQDAFQATFLVLVRKARSIRAGASLGSWLYRVAFNMSIQINSEAARRQRVERRAGEMATPMKKDNARDEELVPALCEEVSRLPEKYRLPVVLCHFEEMTHAQAARQLGWTEGTVRGRVARAREVLRRRLARRGLALSVGAVASELAQRSASATTAAVPAAWIDGTVKAAIAMAGGKAIAAGLVSAPAIAFSEQMVRSLSMTNLKLAVASMLAAGALAIVGAALVVAASQDAAMRKDMTPAAAGAAATHVAAQGVVTKTGEQSEQVPVAGLVLDPEGRPVAGAKLYVTQPFDYFRGPPPPAAVRATTGSDGRFAFRAARDDLRAQGSPTVGGIPSIVAIANGFGPGFGLEPDKADAYTIRLARDDIPVEGRVLDTEGRPVAGARVQLVSIRWPSGKDLTQWRDAVRAGDGVYTVEFRFLNSWSSLAVADLFPATTTGADGRFTVRGIGTERIAGLRIEGPSIRTTFERVVTRLDPTMRVPDFSPGNVISPMTFYGARFDHVADPSRPVVGVVRDKDTGKPIAGASVRSTRTIGSSYRFVQTTTDAEGRYLLNGLMSLTEHNSSGDEVVVTAPEGEPYVPAIQPIIEPLRSRMLTRDFALKRGIWIKGRVSDKATGQPHSASVAYYLFKDNPHASDAETFGYDSRGAREHKTAADGTFRLIGLPGRGLLCARAGNETYRMGVGGERIKETKMTLGLERIALIHHTIFVNNYHVLTEINPPNGVGEASFELALDRGEIVRGRVLDSEGRPLAGPEPRGLADWWGAWTKSLPTAEFEVTGLAPGDVRQLAFLHRERRLSGSLILRGKVQGPVEIKLQPWGTVSGRLVDAAGQPRAGVELGYPENQQRRLEEGPGSLPVHPKTDADGRFLLEGLAPGLKYELQILGNGGFYGAVFKDLSIKAGETRDLGDVQKIDE